LQVNQRQELSQVLLLLSHVSAELGADLDAALNELSEAMDAVVPSAGVVGVVNLGDRLEFADD
jgi:hypothetical protein